MKKSAKVSKAAPKKANVKAAMKKSTSTAAPRLSANHNETFLAR